MAAWRAGARAGLVAGRSTPGRSRRRRSARAARCASASRGRCRLRPLLGGMRPHAFDWYDVDRTAVGAARWLGPDAGTRRALGGGAGRDLRPAAPPRSCAARPASSTLVIGGRYLAPSPETPAPALAVRVGETDLPPVTTAAGSVRPHLDATGRHARTDWLRAADGACRDRAAPTRRTERVFLEQFDLQPQGVPVVALEAGWYEPERDVVSGRQWRWVGDESRRAHHGDIW